MIAREAGFPIEEYREGHFVLTSGMIGEIREQPTYLERWNFALANRLYHIRMQDHSIFLFSEGSNPSYSFLHCPLDLVTFPQYLTELGQLDNPQTRRLYRDQYSLVFDSASERRHVTPIRFDYDPLGYRPGVHPVAHIHIGLENQIRLCVNKMNAVSFVLFVMRQMYPESWHRLLLRERRSTLVKSIRDSATILEEEFCGELDRVELHLS